MKKPIGKIKVNKMCDCSHCSADLVLMDKINEIIEAVEELRSTKKANNI